MIFGIVILLCVAVILVAALSPPPKPVSYIAIAFAAFALILAIFNGWPLLKH